jgi:hypothetical protein
MLECLAIDVASSIHRGIVIDALSQLVSLHDAPRNFRSDNALNSFVERSFAGSRKQTLAPLISTRVRHPDSDPFFLRLRDRLSHRSEQYFKRPRDR